MHSLEKAFLRVSLIFQADDADEDADDEADDDSDDGKDSKDDATAGVDDDVKVSLFMLTKLNLFPLCGVNLSTPFSFHVLAG